MKEWEAVVNIIIIIFALSFNLFLPSNVSPSPASQRKRKHTKHLIRKTETFFLYIRGLVPGSICYYCYINHLILDRVHFPSPPSTRRQLLSIPFQIQFDFVDVLCSFEYFIRSFFCCRFEELNWVWGRRLVVGPSILCVLNNNNSNSNGKKT